MNAAMIHYFPGGGRPRISTPGYVHGCSGYVLDGYGVKELSFPWHSVFPPTKASDAEVSAYRGTLARTMESLIRSGKVSPRQFPG